MRPIRTIFVTTVAIASLAATAVGVTAQDEAATVGSGGRVEVPEAGFAITVPDDWAYIRPQASDVESILGAVDEVEPQLAAMARSALGSPEMALTLVAIAPTLPGSFAENMNIITHPTGGMSLELLGAGNLAQLQGMGWTADLTMHQLPVGEVALIDYAADLGGQDLELALWIYVDGDTQHNLTFTSTERPEDSWLSVAQTMEFLPAE